MEDGDGQATLVPFELSPRATWRESWTTDGLTEGRKGGRKGGRADGSGEGRKLCYPTWSRGTALLARFGGIDIIEWVDTGDNSVSLHGVHSIRPVIRPA